MWDGSLDSFTDMLIFLRYAYSIVLAAALKGAAWDVINLHIWFSKRFKQALL